MLENKNSAEGGVAIAGDKAVRTPLIRIKYRSRSPAEGACLVRR